MCLNAGRGAFPETSPWAENKVHEKGRDKGKEPMDLPRAGGMRGGVRGTDGTSASSCTGRQILSRFGHFESLTGKEPKNGGRILVSFLIDFFGITRAAGTGPGEVRAGGIHQSSAHWRLALMK